MKIIRIISVLFFAVTSIAFAEFIDNKHFSLDANNIRELVINCGAGNLQIQGFDDLKTIEVEAEIVIEGMSRSKAESYIRKHMELSLEEKRGEARLESGFEDSGFSFSFFSDNRSPSIDLIVKVPKGLMLDIGDGSGDIFIEDINNAITLEDGSGEIEISKVIGKLTIRDGSGEITMTEIDGNIKVDDGSGEIALLNIKGNIEIDDGSGDIELEQIIGSADCHDGSGDIDISGISGDIEIDDGSGSMEITDVGGSVAIDDDSGDIRVDSVKGDVEIIDDGSGRCKITNVDGRVNR